MAEVVVLVCDRCGSPAEETATLRVGAKNFVIDLCAKHLNELTRSARSPRRGRRPNRVSATK